MNNLPPEVLLRIFNLVDDDDDLRSLCCSCKSFNDLIQRRIFYRLDFVEIRYPKNKSNKSIELGQFRQFSEYSPHLAYYPRQVKNTINPWTMEDTPVALAALTGKDIKLVHLVTNPCDWWPEAVKSAVETFFSGTTIPLDVILTGVQGLSESCFCSTRHLVLIKSALCGTLSACAAQTLSIGGFGGFKSMGAFVGMPFLTHLMVLWESPSGKFGEWYADLGMALANMPELELLTVQYHGFWDTAASIKAYVSRIQHAVTQYPRRSSLEWRFLNPMETNTKGTVKHLRVLSGWHTIAFQVDIVQNVGDAMLQVATDTFLRNSDNYCVRIDEVHSWTLWVALPKSGLHQSTLVIKGNELDAVERRVHEDVCPCTRCTPLQCCDHITPRGRNWEPRTIQILKFAQKLHGPI